MEFYWIFSRIWIELCSFNSQRDGILLNFMERLFIAMAVSIPNGMEFYTSATKQIPCGYCFNSQRDGILRGQASLKDEKGERFNSQRDGILRDARLVATHIHLVSIPNGMEFYKLCLIFRLRRNGFNSQRDGILQDNGVKELTEMLFQFPTGWNSTKEQIWFGLFIFVSIPNGMEFYAKI